MNTEVSLTDLKSAIELIGQCTEQMTLFLNQASSAASSAIQSVGGVGTAIGAAMNSQIVAVNQEDFDKANESLGHMIDNVGTVSSIYHQENSDLLDAIQNYKPEAKQ